MEKHMSKHDRKNRTGNEVPDVVPEPEVEEQEMAASEPTTAEIVASVATEVKRNFELTFKRNHPKDRASYGIAGNSGIVVFQRGLFKGAVPSTSNDDLGGLPATITLDVELVLPKSTVKVNKDEAAAQKLIEKAEKAKAKLEEQQRKAHEKAEKAQKVLDAAKAKIAVVTSTVPTDAAPSTDEAPATE
jgi:hypothetical protein